MALEEKSLATPAIDYRKQTTIGIITLFLRDKNLTIFTNFPQFALVIHMSCKQAICININHF
jgi:hypothetical protein